MVNFVKENSLDAAEIAAQNVRAQKENEDYILENKIERKSLREQLKESREQKQKEFQEQLEANNSTYKLDEKSAKFYEELRKKEKQKDLKIKQDETRELHRFQQLRESLNYKRIVEKDDIKLIKPTMKKRKKENTDDKHKKDGLIIERKTSKTTIDDTKSPIPTTLGLEGYSSSEDEES